MVWPARLLLARPVSPVRVCDPSATPMEPLLAPAVVSVRLTLRAVLELPEARPLTLPAPVTPLPLVKLPERFSTYPAGPVALLERFRFCATKVDPAWMLPRLTLLEASVAAA